MNKSLITYLFILFIPYTPAHSQPIDVHAVAATELTQDTQDVMDDPAIWINQANPDQSLVVTTKKREPSGGLYVYDLSGNLKQKLSVGPLNNVDIRPGFRFQGKVIDIAVASAVDQKKLAFFAVSPASGQVELINLSAITFEKKPYGLCLARQSNQFHAIVTFKGGGAEKWHFFEHDGKIIIQKETAFPIATQAEGCVANDHTGTLFIAEEAIGIWAFSGTSSPQLIAKVAEHNLVADLEGLAIYDNRYLIVSSQGNHRYGVFLAHPPYTYLGDFQIAPSPSQEGTESTDGIAVTHHNLGQQFSKGLFVAHDNRSSKGGGSNFKLVPWKPIAKGLGLELKASS